MTAPQAKVRRDGHVTLIPASGVVVGDILALEAGDLVAADARLLSAASLTCIESTLTGESEAVTKQPTTPCPTKRSCDIVAVLNALRAAVPPSVIHDL